MRDDSAAKRMAQFSLHMFKMLLTDASVSDFQAINTQSSQCGRVIRSLFMAFWYRTFIVPVCQSVYRYTDKAWNSEYYRYHRYR